jgi:Fe-S-cluster containining protein
MTVAFEARHGRKISCQKGCGACCRQPVPLSPPEAWMIAEMVAALPEEHREQILGRFHLLQAVLRENGFADAPLLSEAKEYFRIGAPCPFLSEDSCSIHHCRPHACREYLVTTPAWLCGDPAGHSIEFVSVPVRLSECLSVLSATLLGGGPVMIPLVYALDWAAQHEEEGRLEWDGRFLAARLLSLANMEFRRESASGRDRLAAS